MFYILFNEKNDYDFERVYKKTLFFSQIVIKIGNSFGITDLRDCKSSHMPRFNVSNSEYILLL